MHEDEAPGYARWVAAWAPLSFRTALALTLAVVGDCSDTAAVGDDAGRDRDGSRYDAIVTIGDAASDGAQADASAADAGSGPACGGDCDPRDPVACGSTRCVLSTGAPECAADGGSLPAGAVCEHAGDCGPGLACFADSATGLGVCAELCCPGDATCGAELRCAGSGELVGGATTEWAHCLNVRACDVVHPEYVCAAREGCFIIDSDGHTECLIAGAALEGEPCAQPADCAAGGVCTGIRDKTCARVCAIDAPRDCGTGRRCEAQAYSPPGTGICRPSLP